MKGVINMKKIFQEFSVKKLLLSILCTTIVVTSLGFTILFVPMAISYAQVEMLGEADENSEEIKEIGYSMQENYNRLKEQADQQKSTYGKDYPAEGIFLYKLINIFKSSEIVRVYMLSLLTGIILGTLIYIIFIQKAKTKQMLVEAIICGIIILILVLLVNIGYRTFVNAGIKNIGYKNSNGTYLTYVYDTEMKNIICIFVGITVVAYIVNLIYQKVLANKLNKKLNNK